MKVQGGCHCGQISYEAEIDPEKVGVCHCTDCQTLTGTAFSTFVPVPKAQFHLRGEPRIYIKTAESGSKRAQAFCPECGTRIYASAAVDPQRQRRSNRRPGAGERRSLDRRPKDFPNRNVSGIHDAAVGVRPKVYL